MQEHIKSTRKREGEKEMLFVRLMMDRKINDNEQNVSRLYILH